MWLIPGAQLCLCQGVSLKGILNFLLCAAVLGTWGGYEQPCYRLGVWPKTLPFLLEGCGGYVNFEGWQLIS